MFFEMIKRFSKHSKWSVFQCKKHMFMYRQYSTQEMPSNMSLDNALSLMKEEDEKIYAKIILNGQHFTITPGDLLITHRLVDTKIGDVLKIKQIYELGTPSYTIRNNSFISHDKCSIMATVVANTRGAKVHRKIVYRRKVQQPSKNLKPHISVLRIKEISILGKCMTEYPNSAFYAS